MKTQVIKRTRDGFTAVINPKAAKKERVCLRCGCTDSVACPGGGSWTCLEVDVCSRCLEKTEDVLDEIGTERHRQDALRAAGKIPFTCRDKGIASAEKFLVLTEEFGEVAEALQRPGQLSSRTRGHLRTELIQLAAVATAWAESLAEEPR